MTDTVPFDKTDNNRGGQLMNLQLIPDRPEKELQGIHISQQELAVHQSRPPNIIVSLPDSDR